MPSDTSPIYSIKDATSEARLQNLVSQVFAEVHGRGRVSGIKAGLRSWKGTYRPNKAEIGAFFVQKGAVIATAILVVPLIALSIGTFGALPIAACVGAVVGLITKKLLGMALHARDVNAILDLVKKGETENDVKALKWDEVRPKLAGTKESAAELADTAERIFAKLVNDYVKLDSEIKDFMDHRWSWMEEKARNPTHMVAMLLKAEVEIQKSGKYEGGVWDRKWGQGIWGGLSLFRLSTKSGDISGQGDRALHRLRRMRFYLRWLTEYMSLHQNAAIEAIEEVSNVERTVIQACMRQVLVVGNHSDCGDVCFGPTDTDLATAEVAGAIGPTVSPHYARFHSADGMDTRGRAVEVAYGAGASLFNAEWFAQQKEGAVVSGVASGATSAVEALGADHAKRVIAEQVAGLAGNVAGEWAAGFIGDGINAAMTEAVQRYRVNRPLQQRVRLVREAMRENDVSGLDDTIAKLAAENDIQAVLQAFLLAHSHYPKRIKERADKLKANLEVLQARKHIEGQSPFVSCSEAATTMRYLVKVYHQAEKQAIHVLFVKFALEAIERKIFREAYKHMMAPALKEVAAFDRAKLAHVEPREADPLARERAIGAARKALVPAATRQTHAADALRRHHVQAGTSLANAARMLSATYVNAAPFALGAFRTEIQAPVLATSALSMDEWRAASSVFMGPRSALTQDVDKALDAYLLVLRGSIAGGARQVPGAAQGAAVGGLAQALRNRATAARSGVLTKIHRWLNDKAADGGNARRPAMQQLAIMFETEIQEYEDAARSCESVLAAGKQFGVVA